jgi:hypothetical protein
MMTQEEKEKYYGIFEFYIEGTPIKVKVSKAKHLDGNPEAILSFIEDCINNQIHRIRFEMNEKKSSK